MDASSSFADAFGRWHSPIVQSNFGDVFELPHRREIVLVLARGAGCGWFVPDGFSRTLLPHQVYVAKLLPVINGQVLEVAAVGLQSGIWKTLWLRAGEQSAAPVAPGVSPGAAPGVLGRAATESRAATEMLSLEHA